MNYERGHPFIGLHGKTCGGPWDSTKSHRKMPSQHDDMCYIWYACDFVIAQNSNHPVFLNRTRNKRYIDFTSKAWQTSCYCLSQNSWRTIVSTNRYSNLERNIWFNLLVRNTNIALFIHKIVKSGIPRKSVIQIVPHTLKSFAFLKDITAL